MYTTSTLADTLAAEGVADIIDLTLVPFGNARVSGSQITCQHGPDECTGNLIETCLIHLHPKVSDYFPALKCIEAGNDTPAADAKKCITQAGLDYEAVMDCANGSEGAQLEMAAANATAALQPPHTYVPWVTLNDDHLPDTEADDLLKHVCKAYTGTAPAGCNKFLKKTQLCYA
mmetsp:Transcript_131808/g.196414  ORF Transcript_131808/g.196414 Transcript_131808/m.196414 type:complete len:174 (-) Transcript_131808:156-677(-)